MPEIHTLAASTWAALRPYLPILATQAAEAAGKKVPETVVKAWEAIRKKFDAKESAREALADLREDPRNEAYRIVFQVQLEKALAQDAAFAEALSKLLEAAGGDFRAQNIGDGATAQGPGAKAVGKGGMLVEGDVNGNITIGNNNKINDR